MYNDNVVRGVMSRVIPIVQRSPCLVMPSIKTFINQITLPYATIDEEDDLFKFRTGASFKVNLALLIIP